MSALSDAIRAIREVLLLQSQVERLEASLDETNDELKSIALDVVRIDRRLIRIETIIEMSGRGPAQPRIDG